MKHVSLEGEGRGEKTLRRHEGPGDALQKVQHPMNWSPRTRGEKEKKKKGGKCHQKKSGMA